MLALETLPPTYSLSILEYFLATRVHLLCLCYNAACCCCHCNYMELFFFFFFPNCVLSLAGLTQQQVPKQASSKHNLPKSKTSYGIEQAKQQLTNVTIVICYYSSVLKN